MEGGWLDRVQESIYHVVRGHQTWQGRVTPAAGLTVLTGVGGPGLDEGSMCQVLDIPPHCCVVDIHEQVIVSNVNCKLESLHKLVMPYKVEEESSCQVLH